MPDLLDRLACGELNETARHRVLTWLEADHVRWRMCGLAFLEAQAWSQALTEWPAIQEGRTGLAANSVAASDAARKMHPGIRRALAALAFAVAFCLGLALHDFVVASRPRAERPVADKSPPPAPDLVLPKRVPPPEHEPLLAALDVRWGNRQGPTTPIRIPVIPARADLPRESRHSVAIPEYMQQQWERRGYKVSLERRFLFARLPSGEPIVVPIEQLNVNPTPLRIN
jgi:hypothetical protein